MKRARRLVPEEPRYRVSPDNPLLIEKRRGGQAPFWDAFIERRTLEEAREMVEDLNRRDLKQAQYNASRKEKG